MNIVDANLLLYAYDVRAEHHLRAAEWLESVLANGDTLAVTWQVVLAFLRVMTDTRINKTPPEFMKLAAVVSDLLARDNVTMLEAGPAHWNILRDLISTSRVRGPQIMDAHLAAMAIEHGATLYSADNDFARFRQVKWVNPLRS